MINDKFKPGDKVNCIDSFPYANVVENKSYIIDTVRGVFISLVGDDTNGQYVYSRFEYFDVKNNRKQKLEKLKNVLQL